MRKLQIAFFTPLNPQKSGLSDYSEELLPHLAEFADIDVVIDSYRPSNELIISKFNIIGVHEFLRSHASYDIVIYQISNQFHQHNYMIPCIREVPGILVLHDYCLHYLVFGLTFLQGNVRAMEEILRPVYGNRSPALTNKLLLNLVNPFEFSFARPFIEMSKAVIVHNKYAMECIRKDFPGKRVATVPMGIKAEKTKYSVEELRSKYGFGKEDFIMASVSTPAFNKRIGLVLIALQDLSIRHPNLKFLILGGGMIGAKTKRMIKRLGLQRTVIQTGWLPFDEYRNYIQLSDLVVDLRFPSGAETSASLLRAIAAGKPIIVSNQGSFQELPDEFSLKITVDENEAENFKNAVISFIEDPERRLKMGEAARDYALSNLQPKHSAREYMNFVSEVISTSDNDRLKVFFSSLNTSAVNKVMVSSIYKIFRLGYLYRNYGFEDTVMRLFAEVKLKGLIKEKTK